MAHLTVEQPPAVMNPKVASPRDVPRFTGGEESESLAEAYARRAGRLGGREIERGRAVRADEHIVCGDRPAL